MTPFKPAFEKWLAALVVVFFSLGANLVAQEIHWVSSTDSQRWQSCSNLAMVPQTSGSQPDIEIYPGQPLQRMDGFGGCFNELGWEALLSLPVAERKAVLGQLFSPEGANFTLCRVPIGSSDYALSYYSYDDVPDDFAMENFSIARDRYILIPFIKAAQEIRPELKLWGSPWSPPAWLKVNQHYALSTGPGNSPSAKLPPEKNIGNNATAFKMENGCLEAYALYLSKYVQAYQKEGVIISGIHVQNEIVYTPFWPSCTWRPEDLAWFIGKYLGPRFQRDNVPAQIWLGTINSADPNYVRTVLRSKEAAAFIKGVGFQWDGKKAIGSIHKEYPDLALMQTESECGNGEKNWKSAEYTWSLIYHYLSNGANAYDYWNMVLDSSGRSSWGWTQNMLISVDKETKAVIYTPEFYLMKHLGHFVLPGAHRLQTTGGADNLAFLNPDGTMVQTLVNVKDAPNTVVIRVGGMQFKLTLPARSFNTLQWNR